MRELLVSEARPRAQTTPSRRQLRVLFMQSQEFFGSDSMEHFLLMRHLARDEVEVHAACSPGRRSAPSASLEALRRIPDLRLRPTRFGPSMHGLRGSQVVARLPTAVPGLVSLAGLALYARRHRIDLVHGTEKPRDSFLGVLLARAIGARGIVHLHVKCESWMSPLVRWAMSRADGLVAVSDFVAESAVAMGYPREKVHTVLNSIDAADWDPGTDGSPVRRELGIPEAVPVLAIIARMFHWKGHLLLAEALGRISPQLPDFRLLVVGADDPRGAPGRGSLTLELRALLRRLGIEDRVILTGWRRDVRQLLAACDVYAMPSFEEPCAVVYLEAMAMARPVVALRSGGVPEVVEHGGSGLLSEPGDVDALAANLLLLLREPTVRERMGRRGRELVETVHTPRRMADKALSVYREVLAT